MATIDKQPFEKIIEHMKQELSALRIGRASAGLVENIVIDSYGAKVPIMHLASISIPDAKTIAIQPWDKSNMGPIEKAILASNIGLNPVNDGILIRLSVPPMTEDRRKEMVKVVGQLAEAARVSMRNAREEIHKTFKQQEEANQLTSDDVLDAKLELQEIVDGYNGQIKDITAAKEKDIMTI
jgi:ribosome recycling factor